MFFKDEQRDQLMLPPSPSLKIVSLNGHVTLRELIIIGNKSYSSTHSPSKEAWLEVLELTRGKVKDNN